MLLLANSEQALHLWFEALCSCTEVVERYYSTTSFIRSPCWMQIKAELRSALLSSFFLLSALIMKVHCTVQYVELLVQFAILV